MKKSLSPKTKSFMRLIAAISLLQAGCTSLFSKKSTPSTMIQKIAQPQLNMDKLPLGERAFFTSFIKNYKAKSPSARKLLSELEAQKVRIEFFDKEQDQEDLFSAGSSTPDSIELNSKIRTKGVSLDDTFFHEGEHVAQLKRARSLGINARSFASLDDIYIYDALTEALAYRKATLCCGEYENPSSSFRDVSEKANAIFLQRLATDTRPIEERQKYERHVYALSAFETNALPNQVYFEKNPDWDQIVSILSRGEVTKVPFLPRPTLNFLGMCLQDELKRHPRAEKLDEFDISCILSNKSELQKDQKAIKDMVSNTLLKTYNMCLKSGHRLPEKAHKTFLYLTGWPTAKQMEEIKQEKITFKRAREINLEKFEISEFFDMSEKFLTGQQIKSLNIPDTQIMAKVLHFEKMILIPPVSNSRTLKKQKVR